MLFGRSVDLLALEELVLEATLSFGLIVDRLYEAPLLFSSPRHCFFSLLFLDPCSQTFTLSLNQNLEMQTEVHWWATDAVRRANCGKRSDREWLVYWL